MAHALSAVRKRYSSYGDPYTSVENMRLDVARATISTWQVWSSARSGVTVPIIAAAARLAEAEGHVDLIVVDYLQLMALTDRDATEAAGLKQITADLKGLAVELGCHVIVVSQMNRAAHTEMRGKAGSQLKCAITDNPFPEPFVEGLMGGAVENDADLVVMLQRHSNCPTLNHMEVVVVKNRNGVPGHGMMYDRYDLCRLEPLTEKDCFDLAGGDLNASRRLRIDAGLLREDWKEVEELARTEAAWGGV
jgi:replicative DNA helicase